MRIINTLKSIGGIYDFDTDGGAIGSIDLQVALPLYAIPFFLITCVLTVPTSATNAANISFGLITTDIAIPVLYTNYITNPNAILGQTPQLVRAETFEDGQTRILNATSVLFTIDTEPLLSGKIFFNLQYIENQF